VYEYVTVQSALLPELLVSLKRLFLTVTPPISSEPSRRMPRFHKIWFRSVKVNCSGGIEARSVFLSSVIFESEDNERAYRNDDAAQIAHHFKYGTETFEPTHGLTSASAVSLAVARYK